MVLENLKEIINYLKVKEIIKPIYIILFLGFAYFLTYCIDDFERLFENWKKMDAFDKTLYFAISGFMIAFVPFMGAFSLYLIGIMFNTLYFINNFNNIFTAFAILYFAYLLTLFKKKNEEFKTKEDTQFNKLNRINYAAFSKWGILMLYIILILFIILILKSILLSFN